MYIDAINLTLKKLVEILKFDATKCYKNEM